MHSSTTSWNKPARLFHVLHYWTNWLIQVCLTSQQWSGTPGLISWSNNVRHEINELAYFRKWGGWWPVGGAGVESGRTNETNWNGESGRFIHVKESLVQTDSFANKPSLKTPCASAGNTRSPWPSVGFWQTEWDCVGWTSCYVCICVCIVPASSCAFRCVRVRVCVCVCVRVCIM